MLSEYDLYLLGEGNHHRSYECMGAHLIADPTPGVRFVVWAPHARGVSVIGDFNGWDGARHRMHPIGGFGLWAGFVAGAGPGPRHKEPAGEAARGAGGKNHPYPFPAAPRPGAPPGVPQPPRPV